MSLRTKLIEFFARYQNMPTKSEAKSKAQIPGVNGPFSIVFDVSNNTIIAITPSVSAANMIVETMLDTNYTHSVHSDELLKLFGEDPKTYPEYSWDLYKRVLKRTLPELVTDELRDRATFARKKIDALIYGIGATNNIRQRLRTGVWFQERVYAIKEEQARAFKNSGYSETLLEKIPYVRQEAEDRSISLVEAAEDIILHADLFNEFLLRSEQGRLSLFRAIKKARTPEEIDAAVEKFRVDGIL